MKAIEITVPGGPEVLVLGERPTPTLKPGEVLIRVAAAGVNRPDVLQRMGNYPVPPGASEIPGLEVAGVIVEGSLTGTSFSMGQRVCALLQGGGYAQFCAVPLAQCLPVPQGLSDAEAACLPETFFTVWSNVFDRAHLAPDETLLVQGGTSGIGVSAIQMAHALGHRVFATAGSDLKARACESLGAERGINYRSEDFAQVVKQLTDNRGVDVILDMVAGSYVPRELSCLAENGRLAVIALLGGSKSEIDVGQILRRRLTITGSTLRPRSIEFKAAIAERLHEVVWPLIESGRIKPVIYKSFPLSDAAGAHRVMESSEHIGKLVLTVPA